MENEIKVVEDDDEKKLIINNNNDQKTLNNTDNYFKKAFLSRLKINILTKYIKNSIIDILSI